jgi:hypothetical protein
MTWWCSEQVQREEVEEISQSKYIDLDQLLHSEPTHRVWLPYVATRQCWDSRPNGARTILLAAFVLPVEQYHAQLLAQSLLLARSSVLWRFTVVVDSVLSSVTFTVSAQLQHEEGSIEKQARAAETRNQRISIYVTYGMYIVRAGHSRSVAVTSHVDLVAIAPCRDTSSHTHYPLLSYTLSHLAEIPRVLLGALALVHRDAVVS